MIQSFRTDRSGQKVQTQIRLLLEDYTVCSAVCILWMQYSTVKPPWSNFRVITANFSGGWIFRIFTVAFILPHFQSWYSETNTCRKEHWSMEEETVIEKNIKQFVASKINEDVALDVSRYNTVSVKHGSKRGSIALAMFWLRVFRHQNNYPMPKYPYKEVYDKQGSNKVLLKRLF